MLTGSIKDSELAGLVGNVNLPSQGRNKEVHDPALLAPKPDDDFRHLRQQQQQQGPNSSGMIPAARRQQAPRPGLPSSPLIAPPSPNGTRVPHTSPTGGFGLVSAEGGSQSAGVLDLASPSGLTMSRYGMHRVVATGD